MRTALLLVLALVAGVLQAGLEPRDEALLQAWLKRELKVPGAMPVGYAHQFEVGDMQEAEVLDRGVYRTIRLHVIAKLEDRFVVEAHNGRGLVVAGLMDNNGVFSRAWAGRAGEKPAEIEYSEQPGPQELFHHALRVPWSAVLYQLPAVSFRDGEKFKLGSTELSVQAPGYELSGVKYELLQSHGEDAWFGPHWQWKAGERVLFKVTRREKLAKPEPLLDWSEVVKGAPKPTKAPEWKPPKDEWEITKREDGSLLVFSYDVQCRFATGATEGSVTHHSPGPFRIPSGQTVLLRCDDTGVWEFFKFAIQQSERLPVVSLDLKGAGSSDAAIEATSRLKQLSELSIVLDEAALLITKRLTVTGLEQLAQASALRALEVEVVGIQHRGTFLEWVGSLTELRSLRIKDPDGGNLPSSIAALSKLERLDYAGKGIDGIGNLTSLLELRLEGVSVPFEVAGELAKLEQLRVLELEDTWISPPVLAKIPSLAELRVSGKAEKVADLISASAKMPKLKSLRVRSEKLLAQDVKPLINSGVEVLTVEGGLERSEDVASLDKLKNVRELDLVGVKGADAAALKALSAPGTLTKLTLTAPVLARSRKASEELAALSAFDYLEELHVREGGMAKAGPLGLAKFTRLKALSLEKLNIEAELLAELVACAKLESLSFAGSLLPQGAVETLRKLKTLKTLNLRGCLSVTPEDVAALKSALPGCTVLN